MRPNAVIFGASGGIGSALVEAAIASERFSVVHAVARRRCPEQAGVRAHVADVADEASIERVARSIAADATVDMVIVATGLLHSAEFGPEKALKAIDPTAMTRLFAVNAIGPAIVAKHFVPLLPREGRSVFAALSARVGSIEDNRLGGWYSYRASKAALNQVIRTLAVELERIRPEAIALALHPGTVITKLSKPFRSDSFQPGLFSPAEAAANLLRVIDSAAVEQSGTESWLGKTGQVG